MKKKLFAQVLAMALVFAMAGCGKTAPTESSVAEEPQVTEEPELPAEDEGQNPVMNFIGVYNAEGSKEVLVEAEEKENAKFTVTTAANPWFHTETVMSGTFDSETLTVEFSNAEMTEFTYNSDGSVREEKTGYKSGSGKAVFNEADSTLTLTITENLPDGDVETVFTWGPSADMKTVTAADHYSSVTAMDKFDVETVVAFNIHKAYLGEDWAALADMIRYPITINETELADKEAFLGYMAGAHVSESDRKAMSEEDCLDMFLNAQGICMGTGQVWLSDPNYMTSEEPKLEIIALSGIETPATIAAEDIKEEKKEEKSDDKEGKGSITVYDREGKAYTLYEGTDGYWRDKEGTAYTKRSDDTFQIKDGTKLLTKNDPTKDGEEREEDFYDTDSVTVYDENGDSFKIYKGSDGYWREEDGTAWSKVSDTEFQRKDGNKRVTTTAPSKDDDDEAEVNSERDFYATPSVKVYDENGESHMLYEGSDGYWREEDGTTWSRNSQKEFQRKGSSELAKTYVWSKDDDDGGEEDFYSSPSVTAYDDDGDAHKLYEGSDGYWREEDGTTYERIEDSKFQLKGGSKVLIVR